MYGYKKLEGKKPLLHKDQLTSRRNPPAAPHPPIVKPVGRKDNWFSLLPTEEQDAIRQLEQDTDSRIKEQSISAEQTRAFSAYVGGSFEYFNSYLRGIYGLTPAEKKKYLSGLRRYYGDTGSKNRGNDEKAIAGMISVYQDSAPTIRHAITVYRGSGKFLLDKDKRENMLSGDCTAESLCGKTIVEPGFLSTSVNKKYAEGFAKQVLLTIRVPAGKQAVYITKNLEGRSFPGLKKLRNENEIIFPPGQEMRITGVGDKKKEHSYCEIEAEMS